jgi:hypothetical protein
LNIFTALTVEGVSRVSQKEASRSRLGHSMDPIRRKRRLSFLSSWRRLSCHNRRLKPIALKKYLLIRALGVSIDLLYSSAVHDLSARLLGHHRRDIWFFCLWKQCHKPVLSGPPVPWSRSISPSRATKSRSKTL